MGPDTNAPEGATTGRAGTGEAVRRRGSPRPAARASLQLLLLFVGTLVAHPAAQAAEGDARDQCLLRLMSLAADDVRVGMLRGECDRELAEEKARLDQSRSREAPPANGSSTNKSDDASVGAIGMASLDRNAGSLYGDSSLIEGRARLESEYWTRRLSLMPHRPSYVLPFGYTPDTTQSADGGRPAATETLVQLSLKMPLGQPSSEKKSSLYLGYTLQAWWKSWQGRSSRPFREYNHEPEIFYSMPVDWRLGKAKIGEVIVGFTHHSNGREDPGSRSWNRLFLDLRGEYGPWWVSFKPWYRIPEHVSDNIDPHDDDNPEIKDRYGSAEWRIGYVGRQFNATLMMRASLRGTHRGAVQLDLTRPSMFNPRVRWYFQYFNGYGESLIDFDRRIRRYGIGLMFTDWY